MAATRRFGSENAQSRGMLLDAAAALMVKEGYPAVTSRRVANEAGLNPALVHYYFHTMDDLFLALYRRRVEMGQEVHAKALASEQPLWALWDLSRNPEGTALTMEFVALANHRKVIRAELNATVERFRAEEIRVLDEAFEGRSTSDTPPIVRTILLSSISRFLAAEESLGMFSGHAETIEFVEKFIRQLEGERRS